MTGATHAAIGAGLGALLKDSKLAFTAGVISHIVADAVPHKDYPVKTEIALMAAAMGFIAARYGLESPQFWGALGAICPDFEHGLSQLGIIPQSMETFPTHIGYGRYHGRESNERISQVIAFAAGMLAAEKAARRPTP